MKVAVVGSGVSGLAATWLLNEYSNHEVHLYEADSRPGGHANTVDYFPPGKSESVPVDTGFIVLNPTTYPNFLRFLRLKNVRVNSTEMTFSVSRDKGLFEWAGKNLFSVFCQPERLLDPQLWRLIYDVLRFNACSRKILLGSPPRKEISIGQYLSDNNYSAAFRDNYLIPMTAAVWSTSPDKCALDFPARTLIQFMHNHHLLQLIGKPSWLTIDGGSKVYVNEIIGTLNPKQLHLSSPVTSLQSTDNTGGKLTLRCEDGSISHYDHVVLACHSNTVLEILRKGNVQPEEERILGKFQWNKNEAVLHCDENLMPKSRLAWSCWNYLSFSTIDSHGNRKANVDQVSLTYWMNELQHISEEKHGPVLVTLNPPFEPRPGTFGGRWTYEHPVLNTDAVQAQKEMPAIQNTRGISYAGAYLKYGFHEDGFTSGLKAVTEHLGVKSPFDVRSADVEPSRGFIPMIAGLFDLYEASGLRELSGFIFCLLLAVARFWAGLFVDLSRLKR